MANNTNANSSGAENAQATEQSFTDAATEQYNFSIGEHIAAFWYDDKFEWYLGVIDSIDENQTLKVSYFNRTDRHGHKWVFPEYAQIVDTKYEQILMRNLVATYQCSSPIRCTIESKCAIEKLDSDIFFEFNE